METSKKEVVLVMAEKSRYKVVLATMWQLLEWAEESTKEVVLVTAEKSTCKVALVMKRQMDVLVGWTE